ncbi:YfcC family protein [Fulvivirga sp. RKSG066]|uniref:YfcC family protein n=1 Tax=Fulvivirga aurantia TaxID=2529383 RepID=UPI0012BBD803|nr:YfcC family protein [Fulvivirga aurantia]MTI19974.1 YfcC family protein [Fulvivirga aurantia]
MRLKFSFPTPYTVLMLVIVIAAITTWLLPAGNYSTLSYDADSEKFKIESTDGTREIEASQEALDEMGILISMEKFESGKIKKPISIPGTYQKTEPQPQGPADIIFAPIKGMYDVIDIVLFVLIIGGFIGVFNSSGAFDQGIGYLANKLQGRESILIVLITSMIALGGTTFGMQEETLAFYPILVPVFLAAGYDLMVPVAVVFIGSCVGIMGGTINPFGTIIASDAAGVNWTIGFASRLAMLILGATAAIIYIVRYAKKVKKDPTKSLLHGLKIKSPFKVIDREENVEKLSLKTKTLLSLFALTFAVMIYGVAFLGWWFQEMTALFLVAAIIIGVLQRIGERNFVADFMEGAKDLLGVSLIIGIARGVTVILNEGKVSDTILFYAANMVEGMSGFVFLPALMFVFFFLALFISSSSGMAVVTMPIMSSLAQVIGVPQEEIVNAYLFGFGLMNIITPTGLLLPSLAMVNIDYNTWLKFAWPLMIILAIIGISILWMGLIF